MDDLRTRDEPSEAPRASAPDDRASSGRGYARAMREHPLLGRDGEHALAAEIEERSHALWTTLLADDATRALIVARATELLPEAAPVMRGARRSRQALREAAARLHALDEDHRLADDVVDRVARAPACAARAGAVAAAARAVADARGRFVQANVGLVFHLAGRYRSTALSFDDFVQEGMFGLIKAVDRFDHRRGHRFSTYAGWWIRHFMGRALADKGRLVRLPVHLQEARHRVVAAQRALRAELGREPTTDEVATMTGLSVEKLAQIHEASVVREVRLDAPVGDGADRSRAESFLDPGEGPARPDEVLEREGLAAIVQEQLAALTEIEREVLRRRFALEGDREETLREIAADHGLSRERIRQIQEGAIRKLRIRLARVDDRVAPPA